MMSSAPSRRAASHRTRDTIPQELALLACGVALAPFGDAVQIVDLRNLFRPFAHGPSLCDLLAMLRRPSAKPATRTPPSRRRTRTHATCGSEPTTRANDFERPRRTRTTRRAWLLSANMPDQCSCFLGLECVSMLLQSESTCSLGNLLNVCFKLLQR